MGLWNTGWEALTFLICSSVQFARISLRRSLSVLIRKIYSYIFFVISLCGSSVRVMLALRLNLLLFIPFLFYRKFEGIQMFLFHLNFQERPLCFSGYYWALGYSIVTLAACDLYWSWSLIMRLAWWRTEGRPKERKTRGSNDIFESLDMTYTRSQIVSRFCNPLQ